MELNDTIGVEKSKQCSLPLAALTFFGKLPGETTLEFANELKALNSADKAEFIKMFETVGFKITPSK